MKITELILKNFGKFTNKQILLSDGINIIYGENESGKTTLHTFLKGMLFGMERKRGRAAATDTFRTYEPWENLLCGNPAVYLWRSKIPAGAKFRSVCKRRLSDL